MDITLHGQVADLVAEQVQQGDYQSPEDLVYEALQALYKARVDEKISQGIADADAGRITVLNSGNIRSFAESIVSKAQQ